MRIKLAFAFISIISFQTYAMENTEVSFYVKKLLKKKQTSSRYDKRFSVFKASKNGHKLTVL